MNGGVQLSLGPARARPKPLFPAHIYDLFELTAEQRVLIDAEHPY